MRRIEWVENRMPTTGDPFLPLMTAEEVARARRFHERFSQYEMTPLHSLPRLSEHLGLGGVYVKDERYRFGLNAFKVLGGSYAMARHIFEQLGEEVCAPTVDALLGGTLHERIGQATFFTATDGNHGRGVAWAARRLGQKAVVFMPKGTRRVRLENILREGAVATIEDGNYDACVRLAAEAATATPGGVVVQDTAWDGYERIPSWIMQGYGTMAAEAAEQLGQRPTHILVQAGVGSLAGAVQGYFQNLYPDSPPAVAVVEADQADCLYRSAVAGDGAARTVGGDMPTIMAGLACGEPNTIAFDILKNHARCFVSCPDWVAASGMRTLGAPLCGDPRVISGESGAVTLGLLRAAMTEESLKGLRDTLGLGSDSVVLLFSTEGDTDPENYRRVCWDGAYGGAG